MGQCGRRFGAGSSSADRQEARTLALIKHQCLQKEYENLKNANVVSEWPKQEKKCFYWEAAATRPLFLGASAPRPAGGGPAAPPLPPAQIIIEMMRGSASQTLLVWNPNILYPDLGTKILVPESWYRILVPGFVSCSKCFVSCRVNVLRVGKFCAVS